MRGNSFVILGTRIGLILLVTPAMLACESEAQKAAHAAAVLATRQATKADSAAQVAEAYARQAAESASKAIEEAEKAAEIDRVFNNAAHRGFDFVKAAWEKRKAASEARSVAFDKYQAASRFTRKMEAAALKAVFLVDAYFDIHNAAALEATRGDSLRIATVLEAARTMKAEREKWTDAIRTKMRDEDALANLLNTRRQIDSRTIAAVRIKATKSARAERVAKVAVEASAVAAWEKYRERYWQKYQTACAAGEAARKKYDAISSFASEAKEEILAMAKTAHEAALSATVARIDAAESARKARKAADAARIEAERTQSAARESNAIRAETAARLTVKATEEAMSYVAAANVSHLLATKSATIAREAAETAGRQRTHRANTE